jgi:peroxidase
MSAYTQSGKSHTARKHLNLEHLEVRQLMAVDLTSLAAPADLLDPVADSSTSSLQSQTTSTSAATASNTAFTPTVRVATRTFDGTNNNLTNRQLGSTDEQLLRVADAEYGDLVKTLGGAHRPAPRVISNAIAAQDETAARSDRQLSAYIYVWGQFLDHDIDLTEPPTTNAESVAIAIPTGDEQFDPNSTGTQVIPFKRSRYDATTGTSTANPREQINQITAWIDASMIYGSDKATADSLRTFVGGKLRTGAGALPPTDASGNFVAGDVRANENVELTSMHALFLREHNRIATQLAQQNPMWTDEQIYQQARATVGAEIQVITYKEFLPALLGPGALTRYTGYNSSVDPSIANEFSTAAFRLHTLINDDVEFFGNDGRAVRDEVGLRDAFFNPALLKETGISTILKYAASTTAQEDDNQIVDGLRNFLFGQPGQGGLDLASLNIQRGRDHGLADYNAVRAAYGLAPVTSFADITSDSNLQQTLQSLYGSVDNIDLWVGALAEDHVPGASVGELARTIIADQFERLRDGDRFWYQRVFSGNALSQIEQTTLASVIRRNTTVNNLQNNVFFMRAEVSGQVYLDSNANGRQDFRENALPGVTVQLINDEGGVMATTLTGRDGRYRFSQMEETGDYQVRVVAPSRLWAPVTTRDVLVSRGGLALTGINFGLRLGGRPNLAASATDAASTTTNLQTQQAAAMDAALASMNSTSSTITPTSFGAPRTRTRFRR